MKKEIKFGVAIIVALSFFVFLNWVYFHSFPIFLFLFIIICLLLCHLASFFAPSPSAFPLSSQVDSASTKPLPFPVNSASIKPLPFPVNSASIVPQPSPIRSASTKQPPSPDLVFSLADKIIDGNIFSPVHTDMFKILNCTSLDEAFKKTIASLKISIEEESVLWYPSKYPGRVLWSMMKRRAPKADRFEHIRKLVMESIWLAQQMEKNKSVSTGVAIWGSASVLSELVMSADPWYQFSIGCICVFMFKLADLEELDDNDEGTKYRLSMLKTWLPFLCCISKEVQDDITKFVRTDDMVAKLTKVIKKLTLEEQKEVMFLWLDHYTKVDFDWINLKECYLTWCLNYQMEFANVAADEIVL